MSGHPIVCAVLPARRSHPGSSPKLKGGRSHRRTTRMVGRQWSAVRRGNHADVGHGKIVEVIDHHDRTVARAVRAITASCGGGLSGPFEPSPPWYRRGPACCFAPRITGGEAIENGLAAFQTISVPVRSRPPHAAGGQHMAVSEPAKQRASNGRVARQAGDEALRVKQLAAQADPCSRSSLTHAAVAARSCHSGW
jgi:hypothetical protein